MIYERLLKGLAYSAEQAWNMPEGRYEIDGCSVLRTKKIVIVREQVDSRWNIVAFPRVEHFTTFKNAVVAFCASDYPGQHQDNNPAAIGTIALTDLSQIAGHQAMVLDYAQAHFRVGSETWKIPRNLATYYGGWRYRCLKEAFRLCEEKDSELRIIRIYWEFIQEASGGSSQNKNQFIVDLTKAMASTGFALEQTERYIRIFRSRRRS